MAIRWPVTAQEFEALAERISHLVGGRRDVAARYFDFEREGVRHTGWGPWKGRRVAPDYQAAPGELVGEFVDKASGELEWRVLQPLDTAALVKHLRGRERLGVYPLAEDATVQFLAADFDDHAGDLDPAEVWAEVRRFVQTCETADWTVHVERSKSGRGYHVWMFFDAPVPASHVRAVGRWLFEESDSVRDDEQFETFDRFFPAQAAPPPNGRGYGNLIGLPLCGLTAYREGRTAWVDRETGELIADPIGYVERIAATRNPAARVAAFLAEWALVPESDARAAPPPREADVPLGTTDELGAVLERCAFMPWAARTAATLSEPLWYAMVSNACRFGGDDWIHAASQPHAGYSSQATDEKIRHARTASGPMTCGRIREFGFGGCPAGGCALPGGRKTAQAPAALAVWARVSREQATRTKPSREAPRQKRRAADADAPPGAEEVRSDPPPPAPAPSRPMVVHDDERLHPETGMPWPPIVEGFEVSTDGVFMFSGRGNEKLAHRPVWVDALTEGELGEDGILLGFVDRRFRTRRMPIARSLLHEQGGALAREFAGYGMSVVPGKEKWLCRFLAAQEHITVKRIQSTRRLGWFVTEADERVFVLPSTVIGKTSAEIVYHSDIPESYSRSLGPHGTLADWIAHVAKPCAGNPLLMFGIMAALAGPLMELVGEQCGGFHVYGTTSGGKTTVGQVAAAVWGNGVDPSWNSARSSIRTWDSTINAMEGIAELHSHQVLVMDEIGRSELPNIGAAVYKLGSGVGKERATISGGLRPPRTWCTMILSNGEMSLQQIIVRRSPGGEAPKGGQLVRMVSIPVDGEQGQRVIVADAHGADPKEFIEALKGDCGRYYGTAGPAFAAYLIARISLEGMSVATGQLKEELKMIEDWLVQQLVQDAPTDRRELPPEGRRILRRFALVALAGSRCSQEIAGDGAQLLPWSVRESVEAVLEATRRWLADVGERRSEMDRAIAHLRDQLIAQAARFSSIDVKNPHQKDLLGYQVADFWLVTDAGLEEICGAFDTRGVLLWLRQHGLLWPQDEKRFKRQAPRGRVFGGRRPPLYWISKNLLGAQVDPSKPAEEDAYAGRDEEEEA